MTRFLTVRAVVPALTLLMAAAPAAATTISAYDRMSEQEKQAVVAGALAAFAQRHPEAAACISAYRAPAPGGAAPRIDPDFAGLLERSRAVAPDDLEVENLLDGLIMVECGVAPEE
jgi:hypothetical protein